MSGTYEKHQKEVIRESLDSPYVVGILKRYVDEGNVEGVFSFYGAVTDVAMDRFLAERGC